MLYYAAIFLIIAILAGLIAFGGFAAGGSGFPELVFVVFLVGFVLALVAGLRSR